MIGRRWNTTPVHICDGGFVSVGSGHLLNFRRCISSWSSCWVDGRRNSGSDIGSVHHLNFRRRISRWSSCWVDGRRNSGSGKMKHLIFRRLINQLKCSFCSMTFRRLAKSKMSTYFIAVFAYSSESCKSRGQLYGRDLHCIHKHLKSDCAALTKNIRAVYTSVAAAEMRLHETTKQVPCHVMSQHANLSMPPRERTLDFAREGCSHSAVTVVSVVCIAGFLDLS